MGNFILGKDYQAQVKNSGSVLVGVAQVRVGLPSIRSAGTAIVKAIQYVGLSAVAVDNSRVTPVDVVTPSDMSTAGVGNTPAGQTLAASGTYTGAFDGCFMIRATSSTLVDIYAPNGYKDSGITISSFASTPKVMKLDAVGTSGVSIQGVPATTVSAGMTWIVPVWSGTAMNNVQTGIISPYSMFSGSNESVGGLKSASFTPKVDSIKTLEAGFPAVTVDRIVEKTSVSLKFEAYEYNNSVISTLKNMVSLCINSSQLASVPAEVVMRTRGNDLISFWIPSCGITQFPDYAPTGDFSTVTWEMTALKQTEQTGATDLYNVSLVNSPIYSELSYTH